MAWDLCSSPPWVPFYPYTMFQNPIPRPSCQKSRKTIITQKELVTQSSHIVHYDWHTQKAIYAHMQAFLNTFSLFKLMFSHVMLGELSKQPEISHFVDFDWENALKWLEWHIFRVRGMPNPMALVLSLYDKWFLTNHNFRRQVTQNGIKNHDNGMETMQQSSLGPILPLHHVSEPYT